MGSLWNLFHKDLRFARETERISAALTKASDQLQDFRLLEFLLGTRRSDSAVNHLLGMVFFFTCSDSRYTIYMGRDKFENEHLIAYGWPEDIW